MTKEKEIVGYGDPECSRECPYRKKNPIVCETAVLCTGLQISAGKQGDLSKAANFEQQQNKMAIILRCAPAFRRM